MNREIKFRAWNKTKKNMIQAFVSVGDKGKFEAVFTFPEDEYEPMQYTGLKDKNGKEIYEGDILKYHNGRLSEPIEFPKDYTWLKARTEVRRWRTDVEVIGNLYENPELLKHN